MDRRARGRTERLLEAAVALQHRDDDFVVILIACTQQRAQYLADRAFETCELWLVSNGVHGLDPARTLVHSATALQHLRASPQVLDRIGDGSNGKMPAHKVFAFIDDADDFGQELFERTCDELTVSGVCVSAVVFTSNV